jgi:hypothetical protein
MGQACLAALPRLDHSICESMERIPLARYVANHFGNRAEFENVLSYVQDGLDLLLDEES